MPAQPFAERDELWVDFLLHASYCRLSLIVPANFGDLERHRKSSQESSMNRTSSVAAAVFFVGTLGLASHAAAQNIKLDRTVTFSQLATKPGTAAPDTGSEFRREPVEEEDLKKAIRGSLSSARVSSAHVPRPNDLSVDGAGAATGFNGLTQAEQRLADGGNQFSIEPPDQGLAVGNGYRRRGGEPRAARPPGKWCGRSSGGFSQSLFLRRIGDRSRDRDDPRPFGHFVSDPRAYFDVANGHWFVTVLSIDTNPATGAFVGRSRVHVAVRGTPIRPGPGGSINRDDEWDRRHGRPRRLPVFWRPAPHRC